MEKVKSKVLNLLINAGIQNAVANRLATQIEQLYDEARRNELRERGRKGGLKKTNKPRGWAAMKKNDPKRYAELQAKSNKRS
jgi:hypothetical protein